MQKPNKIKERSGNVVKERFIIQAYQHGRLDRCEGPVSFETQEEAIKEAKDWASEIPYDENTRHEMTLLKVVAVFRGIQKE